uniref:Remorin C-terminal domain-containing protein n=1 Tax=Araucaria cunninghamii TaxID=56994 RepID=A0A0D6R756_ARACU
MSFPYSSSSSSSGNRFLGYQGDRPRQGIVRWSESQECNSNSESRRGGRFSDHLRIREEVEGEGDCEGGRCREFSRNSCGGEVDSARSHTGGRPPSPSPICSPTNSCSPACSPRDVNGGRSARSRVTGDYDSRAEGSTESRNGGDSRGKRPVRESNEGEEADPSSSRSNNISLALFTGNLHFSRENKPAPENPEDDNNEEIRDIPMAEDRSRSTATANNGNNNNNNQMIPSLRRPRQANWSDTSMGSFISSDGESISLSTEFNAVLAAAAAAGTNSSAQAAAESERLRSILEEEPSRSTSADEEDRLDNNNNNSNSNTRDNMALVPADNNNNNNATNTTSGGGQHQGNRDQRGGRDYLALVPMNGTHESTDRDAPSSSWDAQNNERAMINHVDSGNGNANGSGSGNRGYGSTSSSAGRNSKDVPTPKQLALQKVKRDKIEAKAVAWEEAKNAAVDNRYKREDSIVTAWENEQKVQASIKMKKVERKLEEKRAKAFEKMQNEIARAHRKAEERRAMAEARKGAEKAKITEAVEKIRAFGRLPRKFIIF